MTIVADCITWHLARASCEQVVHNNLRDFGVSVVKSREETGQRGTALVFRGENDKQWFEANRPDLTVVALSGPLFDHQLALFSAITLRLIEVNWLHFRSSNGLLFA